MTDVLVKPAPKRRRRTKLLATALDVDHVPAESRKQAACVLEVLAGVRTPEQAAAALGVSVPTYYNLETRALRGLVHGCAPEPPGRKTALIKRLRDAEAERGEMERQVQRYQALLRGARRAAGLPADSPTPGNGTSAGAKAGARKARKARKPRVRALRAIEALTQDAPGTAAAPTTTSSTPPAADNLPVAEATG